MMAAAAAACCDMSSISSNFGTSPIEGIYIIGVSARRNEKREEFELVLV